MRTYITLLQTNDYLDGVLLLNKSLSLVNSRYPLTVVLGDKIEQKSREILKKNHIAYMEIENYYYPKDYEKAFSIRGMKYWYNTSNKIKLFGLTEFEKCVYLDCDMIVVKNIDHLFEKDSFTAAEDSPMLSHDETKKEHYNLNSGLLVYTPSKKIETELLKLSQEYSLPDQDLIRLYLKDWTEKSHLHLPVYYNYFSSFEKEYIKEGYYPQDVYVFHYIGRVKNFLNTEFLCRPAQSYSEQFLKEIISQL